MTKLNLPVSAEEKLPATVEKNLPAEIAKLTDAEQFIYSFGQIVEKAAPEILDETKEIKPRKILGMIGKIAGDAIIGKDKYGFSNVDWYKLRSAYNKIKNK